MLQNFEDKNAQAECRIAFKAPGFDAVVFTGVCQGQIVQPTGASNFGWDPIFKPNGFEETFAQMSIDTKNSISHRGNAMKQILEYFRSKPEWVN
jgi:inosine triphosphate pyrophosphatase